jgi:hypothetical protein
LWFAQQMELFRIILQADCELAIQTLLEGGESMTARRLVQQFSVIVWLEQVGLMIFILGMLQGKLI